MPTKEQTKEYNRRYRMRHPEKELEKARKYYAKNKDRINAKMRARYRTTEGDRRSHYAKYGRRYYILREYNLTLVEYDILMESQGNKCAICKQLSERKLCVDHDHVTGKIRGLLCVCCNTALGKFDDNLETLERAKEYLIKHARSRSNVG